MVEQVYIVTDLGYGDSGKGTITDFLVRDSRAELVVRYNGGAQAAHNVVLPDGTHHTFSQWGSGTFAGARTFLSKFVVIHPFALMREAEKLNSSGVKNPWDLLCIDENCPVITPYQQAMNRIREIARGNFRHGSCGIGIGETVQDQDQSYGLRVKDCFDRDLLRRKLEATREAKLEIIMNMDLPPEARDHIMVLKDQNLIEDLVRVFPAIFKRCRVIPELNRSVLAAPGSSTGFFKTPAIVFEGSQGVLLDEIYGFHPHTTWSNCTDENAMELVGPFEGKIDRVGVLRTYSTRHGVGPFPSYDPYVSSVLQDRHNKMHEWQREFRCGWFDVPASRYAISANYGIDYLALTHVDRLEELKRLRICRKYKDYDLSVPLNPTLARMKEIGEQLMKVETETFEVPSEKIEGKGGFIDHIQNLLGVNVSIVSNGPTYRDKKWER